MYLRPLQSDGQMRECMLEMDKQARILPKQFIWFAIFRGGRHVQLRPHCKLERISPCRSFRRGESKKRIGSQLLQYKHCHVSTFIPDLRVQYKELTRCHRSHTVPLYLARYLGGTVPHP